MSIGAGVVSLGIVTVVLIARLRSEAKELRVELISGRS